MSAGKHDSLFTRPGNGAVARRRSPPGRNGTTINTNKNTSRRIAATLGAISVAFAGSVAVLGAGTASAADCQPTTDTYTTENTDNENTDNTDSEGASESYQVENSC